MTDRLRANRAAGFPTISYKSPCPNSLTYAISLSETFTELSLKNTEQSASCISSIWDMTFSFQLQDNSVFYRTVGNPNWKRSNELCFDLTHSLFLPPNLLSFSACLCLVHLRFLRSQDLESDFILHWAMKALYKYIATASALIASAILIWLFCCVRQHMEERGRKKERQGEREYRVSALEGERLGKKTG